MEGERSQADASLCCSSVTLAFAACFTASKVHFATTGLSSVLGDPEEGGKVIAELLFINAEIVVEQVEELLFHQIDFCLGKNCSIACPVLIFWTRVVEIFRCDDESGQEYTMPCAVHALSDPWQTMLKSLEVDESAE